MAKTKFDNRLVSVPCPALNDTVKLKACMQCPDYNHDKGCLYANNEKES